ncbi:MAG: ABC transporter permease [Bacillota bacterium]|nr:ABC transporter permease [Bacillota bacterium]
MLNLLKVEFYKLKTSKIFWLMVIAGVVQGIAGPLASSILRTKTGEDMLIFSFQMQQFLFWIPLIGVFVYFIGSEFQTGSIKGLIAYGHRRRDIIIAKSIAFYTGVAVISVIFPLVVTVINIALNGYGRAFDLQAFAVFLRVSLLMTLIYVGMSSLAILIVYVSRNAIVASALFIFLDTLSRMGQGLSFRSKTVEAIYGKTVFYQVNYVALKDTTFSQGLEVVVICLITILLSTAAAIFVFKRADIK